MFEQHNYDLAGTVKADIVDLLESMKKPYKWTDGELEILIKDLKNKGQ